MGRKRLIAVAVVVFVVASILVITQVFGNSNSVSGTACEQLIGHVKNGDAEDAYGLLTESAQASLSYEDWAEQVDGLKIAYVEGSVKHKSTADATAPDDTIPISREIYTVKSGNSEYEAVCFMAEGKINGFSSRAIN
jgi:hypothetical protein